MHGATVGLEAVILVTNDAGESWDPSHAVDPACPPRRPRAASLLAFSLDDGNPACFRAIQRLRVQSVASTAASIQFVMAAGLFVKNTCRLCLPPR
jgi:hypothetical protein